MELSLAADPVRKIAAHKAVPLDWASLFQVKRAGVREREIVGSIYISHGTEVVWSVGEDVTCFGRSLMKAFQMEAIADILDPLLSWEQKAIALSSHSGTPRHREVAMSLLPPDSEKLLKNPARGPFGGEQPGIIMDRWTDMCSGKHAAIVRACLEKGWPVDTYLDPTHPFNLKYLQVLKKHLGANWTPQVRASDGCLLPTFSMKLSEMATLFHAITKKTSWSWEAMRRNPYLVGGDNRLDTEIGTLNQPIVAKEGADGLLGIAIGDEVVQGGLGIIIKLAHGFDRQATWHIAKKILSRWHLKLRAAPEYAGQTIEFAI